LKKLILGANFENYTNKFQILLNNIINYYDRGIIARILSQQIHTNVYHINNNTPNVNHLNGKCRDCQHELETLEHIILWCEHNYVNRIIFQKSLTKIDAKYGEKQFFLNLNNILFPWLNKQLKRNITLKVWKLLIIFCKNINKEYFRFNINLKTHQINSYHRNSNNTDNDTIIDLTI